MKINRRRQGEDREQEAASFLRSLGYTILSRNFTIRGGEIDIIALDGEEIVFVEVRYRETDDAEWTITPEKVVALRRCAARFMDDLPEERTFRFDLIAMSDRETRHTPHFIS